MAQIGKILLYMCPEDEADLVLVVIEKECSLMMIVRKIHFPLTLVSNCQ